MSESLNDRQSALIKAMRLLRATAQYKTQELSCFLEEPPLAFIPARVQPCPGSSANGTALLVNPSFLYQAGRVPPDPIVRCAFPLNGLRRSGPLAWVEDAGTGLWMPFWVRETWADMLSSLQAGLPAPTTLLPAVRHALATATILVPPDYVETRRMQWAQICQTTQAQFQAQGYALVPPLLHPLQLGALRRYYRALVAEGHLPLGDSQVAERYCLHSEAVASFFHPQLTRLVSRIAGEPVKPSYVYFASYRPGADLPRHVDRAQCEFSISFLADYTPEPDGPCAWPLCMEHPRLPTGRGAADLSIGEAVIYRGRELIHYRHPLPAGHQSTSLFFHYVRTNFTGNLW